MLPLIAMAAMSAANAFSQGSIAAAQAQVNNRLSEAEAVNGNRVRGAGNAFAAARGSLSRYIQSMNNNQALEAGGFELEANLVNARRREDTLQEASFEDQIRDSEQLGSQMAAAAFAGVGGEVADSVSVATRLMQQRASQEALQSRDFRLYDDARRAAAIQTQTVRGLDTSLIFDSVDYSVNVATKASVPKPWAEAAKAALGTFVGGMAAGGGAASSSGGGGLMSSLAGLFKSGESFTSSGSGAVPVSKFSLAGSGAKFGI